MGRPILIFDLNGTLVYRTKSREVLVRPRARTLLRLLRNNYNIYIATSMTQKNAQTVLSAIDPEWQEYIIRIFDRSYTLARPTEEMPYRTIRDVNKIAEALKVQTDALTFIDNDAYKYAEDPVRILIVSDYRGSKKDCELEALAYEL